MGTFLSKERHTDASGLTTNSHKQQLVERAKFWFSNIWHSKTAPHVPAVFKSWLDNLFPLCCNTLMSVSMSWAATIQKPSGNGTNHPETSRNQQQASRNLGKQQQAFRVHACYAIIWKIVPNFPMVTIGATFFRPKFCLAKFFHPPPPIPVFHPIDSQTLWDFCAMSW